MSIADWGWNDRWEERRRAAGAPEALAPGRVLEDNRGLCLVAADAGVRWSRPTGRLAAELGRGAALPVTGDWVLVDADPSYTEWPIRALLPRRSALSRKAPPGDELRAAEEQVLAANIDTLFIVCGLDGGRNFTQRGLERALTAAWESGAVPVVVLNKADLADEPERAFAAAREAAPGADVVVTSCVDAGGLDALAPWLEPGRTVALMGRSGVGKSSIINRLAGSELQLARPSRAGDLRGRHTTTGRRLLRLDSGALLMDMPGLRELGLWADEEAVDSSFPEIAELAAGCRFRDCSHRGEPDCAVQRAIEEGTLDPARYESYLALGRELRYLERKTDVRGMLAEKARGKSLSRRQKSWRRASGKGG